MTTAIDISAVILAAGNSARMNYSKAFLAFADKSNFVEKIISTYLEAGVTEIVIVVNPDIEKKMSEVLFNRYPDRKIQMQVNRFPEKGRFYSIQQGLKKVKDGFCFIQNIDNPFISKEMLCKMIEQKSKEKYVVPVYEGKSGHPVLISKEIQNYLLSLNGEDFNFRVELSQFEKTGLNWMDENIFANINKMEHYKKYFPDA